MKRYRINGTIFEAANKVEAAKLYGKSIGFTGQTKVRAIGGGWYKLIYPDWGSSQLTIEKVK